MQAIKQLELLGSPKQVGWHVQNEHHPGKGKSFRKREPATVVLLCNDCCDYFTEDWCVVQNKSEKYALGMPWDDAFQPSPYDAVPDKALASMWCLQAAACTLTHRGGWAAADPEPRSAWSFLPLLPHQNFRQCQTTPVEFLLRQPLLDCSKQSAQSQHRAGGSTALCTCVPRSFKPPRREWGQRFVIKTQGTQDIKQHAHHTIQETFPLKLLLQGHSFH